MPELCQMFLPWCVFHYFTIFSCFLLILDVLSMYLIVLVLFLPAFGQTELRLADRSWSFRWSRSTVGSEHGGQTASVNVKCLRLGAATGASFAWNIVGRSNIFVPSHVWSKTESGLGCTSANTSFHHHPGNKYGHEIEFWKYNIIQECRIQSEKQRQHAVCNINLTIVQIYKLAASTIAVNLDQLGPCLLNSWRRPFENITLANVPNQGQCSQPRLGWIWVGMKYAYIYIYVNICKYIYICIILTFICYGWVN